MKKIRYIICVAMAAIMLQLRAARAAAAPQTPQSPRHRQAERVQCKG
ncbi:MAG: hypothetical protein ACLSES_03250 [Christensenellales bacterium]